MISRATKFRNLEVILVDILVSSVAVGAITVQWRLHARTVPTRGPLGMYVRASGSHATVVV